MLQTNTLNLLQEIIATLSSQSDSLTDALLKTKVLLHKIGHKELSEWVNNELNGYSDTDNVPAYRVLPAQVLANLANRAYHINSHPIPLNHLSNEQREPLETVMMKQSLAILEKLVEKEGGHLQAPIPMEANGLLGKTLGNGYIIQQAWCQIGQADVALIFVQVRSRLLDFLLELQGQLGDNVSEQEIKKQAGSFDASGLFNNAIFGNNTTIVVGSHNHQEVSNTSVKGDFNALANELRQHGIRETDISALGEAINTDSETTEIAEEKYGPSVKIWLKNMLSKVIDASWQIDLGVASGLLTTAIQKYYGWL